MNETEHYQPTKAEAVLFEPCSKNLFLLKTSLDTLFKKSDSPGTIPAVFVSCNDYYPILWYVKSSTIPSVSEPRGLYSILQIVNTGSDVDPQVADSTYNTDDTYSRLLNGEKDPLKVFNIDPDKIIITGQVPLIFSQLNLLNFSFPLDRLTTLEDLIVDFQKRTLSYSGTGDRRVTSLTKDLKQGYQYSPKGCFGDAQLHIQKSHEGEVIVREFIKPMKECLVLTPPRRDTSNYSINRLVRDLNNAIKDK